MAKFHFLCLVGLDVIWTPAYYGELENLDNVGDDWFLYSTKDGDLHLRRGKNGIDYPVKKNGQYEVKIDDSIITGQFLSQLMNNVCEVRRLHSLLI